MKIKLRFDIEETETNVSYIGYWYNRPYRSWVVQVFDDCGNEVDSKYSGNKADRDVDIKFFAEKYNINDIRKI